MAAQHPANSAAPPASTVLAVRASEYGAWLAPARFSALPREEIERLHGCVDVMGVERALANADPTYLPLRSLTVVHYNYSWLTLGDAPPRSLGLENELPATAQPPAFLDAALQRLTQRAVETQLSLPECEWRLVGLLHDTQLVLVYLARLRRVWSGAQLRDGTSLSPRTSGELRLARDEFDSRSQTLIGYLDAF
ncbi:MAG TPA: hypothetical protein VFZ61_26845 [Polyangiales bacterium]